jgi:hypothetical protein
VRGERSRGLAHLLRLHREHDQLDAGDRVRRARA